MTAPSAALHARALERFAAGAPDEAATLLREAIDPDLLNDLAVALGASGDRAGARALLEALAVLAPGSADAAANLAGVAAEHVPDHTLGDDRRAAFLQVVAEAQQTHLADNVDLLFEPWGRELPDPAAVGARLATQLDVLDRCATLWAGLGDDASRALLLRFLAFRALGPAHVRLQLDAGEYRRSVIGMTARLIQAVGITGMPGLPYEWSHHLFDFAPLGTPLVLAGPPLPLASTVVFSQYAYRDAAAAPLARPLPGDVVLDVGGCWGETALWMAHHVGPGGRVHCFEPGELNRTLLAANLERNPEPARRVTLHAAPLAAEAGQEIWVDDVAGAGVTTHVAEPGAGALPVKPAVTDAIDAMVARGALERIDLIKMDVEGAELEVLKGAASTLRTQRPRLALSAYHRPDDLAVLPAFVASLGLEYEWFLQCSTMTDVDTILFGVPVA
jgi:FkbM family methyltransferase